MGVLNPNEVLLNGVRYKIRGPVNKVLINPFPGKLVTGDYGRENQQLASSWIIDDNTGGLGKENIDESVDIDRFYFSTLDTRFRDQLSLLPRAIDAGGVVGKANVVNGIEFNGRMYVCFDDSIYLWTESTQSFSAALYSMPGTITDVFLFRVTDSGHADYKKEFIVMCDGDNLVKYDGVAFTNLAGANKYKYLATYDDKLFVIGEEGILRNTTNLTVWTDGPFLSLAANSVRGLFEYFNVIGDPALYVATNQGLHIYDDSAGKLRPTKLKVPRYAYAGVGNVEWRGDAYYSSGLDIYRFQIVTLTHMGLNRDDGIPQEYRGNILKLVPALSWLFAVLDQSSLSETLLAEVDVADPLMNTSVYPSLLSMGAIFAWNERGWHTFHAPSNPHYGCKWAYVSSADSKYRLWFGSDGKAWYIDLNPAISNTLHNPTQEFQPDGYYISGWFDGKWSEIDKIWISLGVDTQQCSATETIKVWYGVDGNPGWTLLSTITDNGMHDIPLNGGRGFTGRKIRFKIEMARGVDVTKTPVMKALSLIYLKNPDARYAYTFTIDNSDALVSEKEIKAQMEAAVEADELIPFAYQDDSPTNTYVKITRHGGNEYTGYDERGLYQVSVAEI